MKSEIIDWDSMGEEAKKLFAIPELSDEEIAKGADDFIMYEIYDRSKVFEIACKWYREQLKSKQ